MGVRMKKGKIIIDDQRCKGCYLCVRACPQHVLTIGTVANAAGTFPALFAEKQENGTGVCIACGSCYEVCPDTAIEVYELEGDEK
jgi:2-oxoglutarate ferredoxin oxidoreductase subunit delta